jgi:hypothetical protein
MPQQLPQIEQSKKARIQLALKAIKQDPTIPLRRVAADYNVPSSTLSDRRAGRPSQADRRPKTMNLGKTEEKVIVQHILDLVKRGFPPRLADVADMANSLRAERNLGQVGPRWPITFVKRQPELQVKFNRKYDYKRALCEDPKAIRAWF